MRFEGFPDEGLVFYEGLEADNTKTYWTRHKAGYDEHVRAPLLALIEELTPEFGTAKVFRPYRDVRFSNDKTPYKTHQGAVVTPDGRGAGSWYVQISAHGLRVSGGCWRLESDQVDRYRRAVADDVQGPRLQAEVDRLAAAGFSIDVNCDDGLAHPLALYLMDWANAGRADEQDIVELVEQPPLTEEGVQRPRLRTHGRGVDFLDAVHQHGHAGTGDCRHKGEPAGHVIRIHLGPRDVPAIQFRIATHRLVAADGEQVGAHAEVAALLVALGVDGIEAADHDVLEAVVDLVLRPEEVLQVLHPLEVADGHATGVREDVGDDGDAAFLEDRVGLGGSGAVGCLDDEAGLDAVGVGMGQLAFQGGGDKDVTGHLKQGFAVHGHRVGQAL